MFRVLDCLETSDEDSGFYETSVIMYQLPRHQEDLNLHQHRYDNLQSRADMCSLGRSFMTLSCCRLQP